jgi:hypothetical protein
MLCVGFGVGKGVVMNGKRKAAKVIAVAIFGFVLIEIIASVLFPHIHWVGRKDVDVVFQVMDRNTGQGRALAGVQRR